MKMSNLLKHAVARLLLFGIPFALSYLATRPAQPAAGGQAFVVCAYPTDRPGELRISLDRKGCAKEKEPRGSDESVTTVPAVRTIPGSSRNHNNDKEPTISF